MAEQKAPGPIKRTFKYLVSPRLFLSAEDVSKYGGFSVRYHKELFAAIKAAYKRLKEKKASEKLSVSSIEDRFRVFYDSFYERGVKESEIEEIHSRHRSAARLLFVVSVFFIVLSGYLFYIPNITLIPNAIIAIATALTAVAIIINGLSHNYYAWLIEQRLLPELFNFINYMKKPIKRWPKPSLSKTMSEEIIREYKERDQVLRDFINDGKTLDEIGLSHLKERVGE